MRLRILASLVVSAVVCLASHGATGQQSNAAGEKGAAESDKTVSSADPVFTSGGDFTYTYPADWAVIDTKPIMPIQRLKAEQQAQSDMERKGADCADVQLTVRHGEPTSVIVLMFLEFKCLGVELKESDLGATGMGIAQGLTKSFTVKEPKYGAYSLGKHAFWIERADGSPVGHPERQYKLETSCTLLKKGLACWLAMAGTPDGIITFEASKVSLEGDSPAALVPASAFALSR